MAGFGLKLVGSQGMEGFTGNLNEFLISPSYTDAIFTGDVVNLSSGYVEEVSGNTPGAIAAPILGVFMGCRYVDSDGSYVHRAYWDGGTGRTNIYADVAMPQGSVFHVKGDGATSFAQSMVGGRHELVYVAGSTVYGQSRLTIGPADAAGPVIINRLVDLPGNAWGVNAIVEVTCIAQTVTAAELA